MKRKKQMREFKGLMLAYWGTRCKDFNVDCPGCRAWAAFDLCRGKRSSLDPIIGDYRTTPHHRGIASSTQTPAQQPEEARHG